MRKITLPFTKEDVLSLRAYERIELEGTILVGRDQVHKRLVSLLKEGKELPIDLENQTIYYMGPATKPPDLAVGSAGPTTSARMDPFTPQLLEAGLIAVIGKGPRSEEVREAIIKRGGVYLVAFGGCGALYATKIVSQQLLAFDDLGPEALTSLEVKEFPVIVGIDSLGNSVFS